MMDLQAWMDRGRAMDCTDLHLTVGLPVVARMLGELTILGDEPLTKEDIHSMLATVMNRTQQEEYQKGDLDFGFQDAHGYSVRVNAYYQKGNPCAALRLLRNTIPSFDDLMIPEAVRKLSTLPRGLVLVTGPTGSGKSTTMAAMINSISHERKAHIITIEDPIEYRFEHASSVVHQREVGVDVASFADALRSALREDPDVILVGEMRDFETIQAAIRAAESGHLVISTLHTNSAVSTIDRIIDVFPEAQQGQIRVQLASVLKGVVTQQLLVRQDQPGRLAAFEILLTNDAIASMIRENKAHQISSVLQTGQKAGMRQMDYDLARLVQEGKISEKTAHERCLKEADLQQYLSYAPSASTYYF